MKHYILDEQGNAVPINDIFKWAAFMRSSAARTNITLLDNIIISTAFLGYDHSFDNEKEVPILWETMIFGGKHDQHQERYTSKEEAMEGHERAVKMAEEDNWR